jgi:hypothetical protein
MKANHKSSRRTPASFVLDDNQPDGWLALLAPFLTYVNMRTLALLMFVSFAVLNTTHGNAGETKRQVSGNSEPEVIANGQRDRARAAAPPSNCTTFAPAILWQLASKLVKHFEMALNDPALIQYAKEQGVDTSSLPAAVSQDPAHQSRISSSPSATY